MDSHVSTAPAVPACTCRACGSTMEAKYQAGYATRAGHFSITCWQPGCWMKGFTFADITYARVDLSAYRK